MRRIWLVLAIIAAGILQLAFLPAMRPFGIVPDLLLVSVVLVGLESTVSQALILAVIGGLLLDLSSGADFGLRTGLFVLLALAAGLVHRAGLNTVGPVMALGLVAVGTVLQTGAIVATVLPQANVQPAWVGAHLVIELMVNLILVILLLPLVRWLTANQNDGLNSL